MPIINVGFLRKKRGVKSFFDVSNYNNTLFRIGAHYGIRWVLFAPEDIDFNKNMVNGIILNNGEIEKCAVELPKLVDYYAYSYIPVDQLKSSGMFLYRPSVSFSKSQINNLLKNDGKFADILIPTKRTEKFEDIIEGIDNYKKIVVKPIMSHSGQGVRSVSHFEDKYRVMYKKKHFYFTHNELRDNWYPKRIAVKDSMIQPYIASMTKNGEPFHIRVSCRRGSGGRFGFKPYVFIGNPNGIVSNLGSGGYIFQFDLFLRTNYNSESIRNDINNQIRRLGNEFPDYFCSLIKARLPEVGLDIGITTKDDKVKLWLFEVNFRALSMDLYGGLDDAIRHCEYMRYLAEKMKLI